jgi:hypothetical protein
MITDPQDTSVINLFRSYQDKPLDTKTLSDLTANYSADVATFYFLQEVYRDTNNKQAQDYYTSYLHRQLTGSIGPELETLQKYFVVFVPGLAYKEDTSTGANFDRQRQLLISNGVQNELVETGEWDLVEVNASRVAVKLKELSEQHENIIVVSASKGGLETALALGRLMKPEETNSIKAWISVGGILRGSPVADDYLTAPKSWFAEFILWTKGKTRDVIQDMSYKRRSEEFKHLQFPDNIKIIHFIGAPLATRIDKKIESRYCSMIKLGPNDGLTPLADEITKNGIVVFELGLDHYFRDPNIDTKTLALALVAAKIQN